VGSSSKQPAGRGRALWAFCVAVAREFHRNQGLLLSGAVAYYTLLSMVPLFTLLLVALSHVVDEHLLLATLDQLLGLILPGHSGALLEQVTLFLRERDAVGWILLGVLVFFSSIAFSVLENAMGVIFHHRSGRGRHFLVSAIIPYLYIMCLALAFLLMTLVTTALQTVGASTVLLFGYVVQVDTVSRVLIHLLGLGGQILILASIYMVMPVGTLSWRHALIGGVAAGLVWEMSRNLLVWYFSTLSFVNVVYGSLATVIFLLLGQEVAAVILLLGAQVIAEYERRGHRIRLPDVPDGQP
jgi:YihY family inner membrane protein